MTSRPRPIALILSAPRPRYGRFSQNDLVQVSRELEVTPGVVVGAGRTRVYGTAPTWTPGGNSNASGINTGSGGVQAVRAALRFANVEIPSQLVFGLNDLEMEDVLRDTFPVAEVTVTGSLTFDQTGTHEDGSTGPVITATAGTFDDIFDADHVGAMMEISGSGLNAANKWPRVIKAVKADGSKIDIDPLYTTGASGQFREPLFDQGPIASSTIRVGKIVKNQGIENIRSCNFEFNFTDQPGGSFVLVKGCHGASMKLSFTGKGNVELSFMYEGMDYNDLLTASVGSGVTDLAAIANDVMSSGEDLAYFAINGITLLSGDNLTSFNVDGNGNASGIDDTSGNRFRPGVTVGDMDFTGSLKIYHEHTKAAVLHSLGRSGNRGPIDWKLIDPAGNFYWGRLAKCLFDPNGPKPGAKNSRTDSSINFKTQLGRVGERTFIWQKFAAA
jgi:hypothetical protein